MNRREIIRGLSLLGTFAACEARPAGRVYRVACPLSIGSLTAETAKQDTILYGPVLQELHKNGFIEGENLRFEFFSVDGHFDRMPEMAAAIVRSKPDVIFVTSSEFAQHFKRASSSIPVVAYMNEAVFDGFADTLARPGRNFTGISWSIEYDVVGTTFDLLRTVLPRASRVAALYTANFRGTPGRALSGRIAQERGFTFVEAYLRSPVTAAEFRYVFEQLPGQNVDAIAVFGQPETFANLDLIVGLTKEFKLPALFGMVGAVQHGGLLQLIPYPSWPEVARVTAEYVTRVLRGATPAELAIFHADRVRVGVNLRTAKALGITIPESLLARADEVIE